jgi:threonine aldolase
MRQAGVIAAAALYALDHNVDRLAEDHARARRLAEGIGLDGNEVETNFVEIEDPGDGIERLQRHGVLVSDLRPGFMRAVTHLGVTDDDIDRAIELIPRALAADRVHA